MCEVPLPERAPLDIHPQLRVTVHVVHDLLVVVVLVIPLPRTVPPGIKNNYNTDIIIYERKYSNQCCGSGIRLFSIPDPGSELSPSRIPDPYQRI